MATKAAAKTKVAENGESAKKDDDFFKGYEDHSAAIIDGWYTPKEGSRVSGTIEGLIKIPDEQRPGELRDVVLVKLDMACDCATKDGEEVAMEEGQILAIGVREQLKELPFYVTHKGKVRLEAVEKQKLGKGKTMWVFKIGLVGKQAPPPLVAARGKVETGDKAVTQGEF